MSTRSTKPTSSAGTPGPGLRQLLRGPPERRFTLLFVPEGGAGEVRQWSLTIGGVRRALRGTAATFAVLALATISAVWWSPRALDRDRAVAENEALRARLGKVERKLGELDPLLQRVRAYDDQLRDLATRQALPGFGDLEPDEEEARQAWLAGEEQPSNTGSPEPSEDLPARLRHDEARLSELDDTLATLGPRMDQVQATLQDYESLDGVLPQVWPVEDPVLTSPFGWRKSPYSAGWKFHGGLDLAMPYGSPIVATNEGLVTFAGWDSGHGNMVVLDHGHGVASRYCHASKLLVSSGDQVKDGDLLALVGSTGVSTGPHLHYELFFDGEKVDPLPYLP